MKVWTYTDGLGRRWQCTRPAWVKGYRPFVTRVLVS